MSVLSHELQYFDINVHSCGFSTSKEFQEMEKSMAVPIDISSTLFSAAVPYLLSTAGGGFMGYVIGIFLKHAIKIILFVIGGLFTFLGVMAYKGYISANFPLIQQDTLSAINGGSQTLGHALQSMATQFGNQSSGYLGIGMMGFVGGLVLGLKH